MTKSEARRKEIVKLALGKINIPDVVLLNRVNGEKSKLAQMLQDKLEIDLLEQECSNIGHKPFDFILEDFKNCTDVEDFAWLLPKSYGNNGELYFNDNYHFFDDDTGEDDLQDYKEINLH